MCVDKVGREVKYVTFNMTHFQLSGVTSLEAELC